MRMDSSGQHSKKSLKRMDFNADRTPSEIEMNEEEEAK